MKSFTEKLYLKIAHAAIAVTMVAVGPMHARVAHDHRRSDVGDNARWSRRKHQHAFSKKRGFGNRMRDHNRSEALAFPQCAQFSVEFVARDFVETAEGFVEQQKLRAGHQRARDRRAHLHASRELMGISRVRVVELHQRQRARRALQALVPFHPSQFKRERDIL
jgi:hypothetical protein